MFVFAYTVCFFTLFGKKHKNSSFSTRNF